MDFICNFWGVMENGKGAFIGKIFGVIPIKITPNKNRKSEKSPEYRVLLGGVNNGIDNSVNIGAAWKRTSKKSGKEFLSIKINNIIPGEYNLFQTKERKSKTDPTHKMFRQQQENKSDFQKPYNTDGNDNGYNPNIGSDDLIPF